MLSKSISLIVKLIIFIMQLIFTLITSLFPSISLSALGVGIEAFFGLMNNACNMSYFLIGSGMFIYLDIILIIWTTKHTILPMVCFVRKIFMRG